MTKGLVSCDSNVKSNKLRAKQTGPAGFSSCLRRCSGSEEVFHVYLHTRPSCNSSVFLRSDTSPQLQVCAIVLLGESLPSEMVATNMRHSAGLKAHVKTMLNMLEVGKSVRNYSYSKSK